MKGIKVPLEGAVVGVLVEAIVTGQQGCRTANGPDDEAKAACKALRAW